jgi:hypothetical protein
LDTYDQITARTGAFSGLTPFYSENTGVSDTWRRLTYDVDIPAGYGTIVCRWSSNQPGSMAGIDNFLVTRDASVNRGEPAVAATRKITTRFVNGRMICSLPTAVRRLTVDVFTLTGRRAKHVAHRTLDAGTYTIPLAELPAGHYTVRIVVDDLERLHRFSRL